MPRFYDVVMLVRRRMAKMGLDVSIEQVTEDYVVMAITWESILKYLRRTISRTVDYPKHFIHIDEENKIMAIHIWRKETPQEIQALRREGEGGE